MVYAPGTAETDPKKQNRAIQAGAAAIAVNTAAIQQLAIQVLPQNIYTSDNIGLIGDGLTDNSPALQAWANKVPTGAILFMGPGTFKCLSKITFSLSPLATALTQYNDVASIKIIGAGHDLTIFNFPSTSGLEFDCQSFQHTVHLHDLTFTSGATNSGTAVKITNSYAFFGSFTAQHEFNNCTWRGSDGYGVTNYFSICVDLFNVTNVNFDNCNIYGPVASAAAGAFSFGTGVNIVSSSTPGHGTSTQPGFGTSYNFSRTNIVFQGVGINIGLGCQALSFSNGSAILNGAAGINVPSSVTEVRQISCSGAQIAVNDNAIIMGSGTSGCTFTGNYIGVAPSKIGIEFLTDTGAPNGAGSTVVGNTFVPLGAGAGTGVYINTSFNAVTVVGNTFNGLTTAVAIDTSGQNAVVGLNGYTSCTNNVIDSGSNNSVIDDVWKSYTPTLISGSGTLTTASATGKYKRIGKTIFFEATISITTNGTGATNLQISTPFAFAQNTSLAARENAVTGFSCSCVGSSSTIFVTKYDGTYLGANGYAFTINGVYETT